jgi:signal transduction histidine kinase
MLHQPQITSLIENIKMRSLSILSLVLFFAMVPMIAISIFFPDLLPKDEITPSQMLFLTSIASTTFFLSAILAYKKMAKLAYILFFSTIYIGVLFVLITNPGALQFQNCFVILVTASLIATYYLDRKLMIAHLLITTLIIDVSVLYFDVSPNQFLAGFIFFHVFNLTTFWIHTIKNKIEKLLIERAEKDAKLQQIGYITSSIAHEINNPLSIISGANLSLSKILSSDSISDDKKTVQELLHSSGTSIKRIDGIVKSMYGLIKSEGPTMLPLVKLSDIIGNLGTPIRDLEKQHNLNIEIKLDNAGDYYLNTNISEVIQIIINLLRNSCHSVSETTSPLICLQLKSNKDYISFDVIDSGRGIDDAVSRKLGDAFKTGSTKGLGLGLSISMYLAEKNKGQLEYIQTNPQTTFSLKLPYCYSDQAIKKDQLKAATEHQIGNIYSLKDNLIVMHVYKNIGKISEATIKDNIDSQIQLLKNDSAYKWIVQTENAELSLKALLYFNKPNIKKRFQAGALIGNSKATVRFFNIFTKVIKLPYPLKMFNDYESAYRWINKV